MKTRKAWHKTCLTLSLTQGKGQENLKPPTGCRGEPEAVHRGVEGAEDLQEKEEQEG